MSEPGIVSISDEVENVRTITGEAPGSTTVTVTVGGFSHTFDVVVVPAAGARP